MASLEFALRRYHSAGLRPILLWGLKSDRTCACERPDCNGSSGKHPTAARWQTTQISLDALLHEIKLGPRNVGLAMGAQPRGDSLVALDCDGPDSLLTELESVADCRLPETLYSVTRRGKHLIYSAPDGVVLGNRARLLGSPKHSPDIDIRGEGGQIVAPPSMHYSGHVYRWGNTCSIATLPDALIDWLKMPAPVRGPRTPSGDVSREVAFERAKKYMQRVDPAISGQGGHTATFTACKKLVGNFPSLTESDYWTLLLDWNQTCDPPWSERELRHKLKEAMKR